MASRDEHEASGGTGFVREVRESTRLYIDGLTAEIDSLRTQLKNIGNVGSDPSAEHERLFEQYAAVESQNESLASLYVATYRLHGDLRRGAALSVIEEIVANLIGSEEVVIFEGSPDDDVLTPTHVVGVDLEHDRAGVCLWHALLDGYEPGRELRRGPRAFRVTADRLLSPDDWRRAVRGDRHISVTRAETQSRTARPRNPGSARNPSGAGSVRGNASRAVRGSAQREMKRTSAAAASPGADPSEDRRKVFLSSGRIIATTEPTDVTTVLGSCVAACLWDPAIRAGAACRFVLPYGAPESSLALRLANVAIHEMARKLVQLGGDVSRMQAKIFGGANIMPSLRSEREPLGTRNVIAADEHLASVGIPVVARDVGGKRARKLIFKTDDGTAWVKTI